jgi:hypothetical protein
MSKTHKLGWSTGVLYEHDDGTVSFRRPGNFVASFRVRISDVTGFSETKGGKRMGDFTLHVFGRGGELLSCQANMNTAGKLDAWFREHPDFAGNQSTAPGASSSSTIDDLVKLGQLGDSGVLTEEEFHAQSADSWVARDATRARVRWIEDGAPAARRSTLAGSPAHRSLQR